MYFHVLERIMYKRLDSYLTENNIMFNKHFGFRAYLTNRKKYILYDSNINNNDINNNYYNDNNSNNNYDNNNNNNNNNINSNFEKTELLDIICV